MSETLEKITRGSDHGGGRCALCRKAIAPNDEVVVCPRCRQIHHVECWRQNGGCGKTGCPQTAKAVTGEKPPGDGPPPPMSKQAIFGAISLIVIVIAAFILWPKPPDPALGRTKLVFLGEAGYDLQEVMMTAAEEFNSTNEELYLELQLLPPGTFEQKFVVLVAAGQAPDIAAVSEEQFTYLRDEGALMALGKNEAGEIIYGLEHPLQQRKIVVWGATEHPAEAKEALYFLIPRIKKK